MLRLDCTNTELLNKFEEIKTENVFNNDLKKLFNTENYEEEINDDVYLSFKRNLHFDNKKERYEIRLPFKDCSEILPDNSNLAKHRPNYLKNRLSNNNDLFNEYDKIIKDYIKEDIVEIVPPSEEIVLLGSAHYLPHRAVVNENRETTKVRTVFDGSAHSSNEPSINDVLYCGPCLLPLIFDILIRFRTRKIRIVADVKQAFHQIETVKEHRDFQDICNVFRSTGRCVSDSVECKSFIPSNM